MDKTQLLADIESKVLKVVATNEEADSVKNAANVRMYTTHVMEQQGLTVVGKNIGWYTIDEGTPQEKAFYRDVPVSKNNARAAVVSYLDSLLPATYLRYELLEVNEDNRSARAKVYKDNGDGTATEKIIFMYKNGEQPIAHRELT